MLFDERLATIDLASLLRSKYDISRNRGVVGDVEINIYTIYKPHVFKPFEWGS
jgi:hypothetical protein